MKKKTSAGKFPGEKSSRAIRQEVWCLIFWMALLLPSGVHSQEKKVTIEVHDASLIEVISTLEKSTGFKFLYKNEVVMAVKNLTFSFVDEKLSTVLDKILEGRGLTWTMDGKNILLEREGKETASVARSYKVTGKVTDTRGEPLPGVTVLLENTTLGTATSVGGEYSIECGSVKNPVLVFSFMGMKTQRIELQGKMVVNVKLEENAVKLEETVITGIYTRNIESFTGAISTFKKEELKQINPTSVLRSLSVLDPSFIITENRVQGSNPNARLDISINGKINVTDLTQEYTTDPNQPLFILDGFETTLESIQDLNMDRVESISILKDASATAIYGSRAANGVVVIETVKPKEGQLRFSYSGNFTVSWPDLSDFNLMDAAEKLEFEKLAGVYSSTDKNGGKVNLDENGEIIGDVQRSQYYTRLKLVKEGHDTYWLNEPLRDGFVQGHNIYIDGGDKTFLYGVGLSYNDTKGVMKKSDRSVLNGNIRLTYRVGNLSFTNQATVSNTKMDNNTVSFSAFSRMNPFYDKRTSEGEIPKYVYNDGTQSSPNYVWNPMWDFEQKSFNRGDNWAFTNNFQIEMRLLTAMRIRGNLQYEVRKDQTETFRSPNETSYFSSKEDRKGMYTRSNTNDKTLNGRVNITYGRTFGDHTINGVAGMQFRDKKKESSTFEASGYTTDQFYNPNFSKGYPEGGRPRATDDKTRSASYYVNGNYAYKMRYLFDFNITSNGASQFGIDDPFTTTWSIGFGWNVHQERFLENNSWLNYLKFRYSLGNPGLENFDAKLSSSIYSYVTSGTNPFGLAARVSTWGNRNLEWQRTMTHNFGLDIRMFNDRLYMGGDYQIRKTDPMLVRIDLPTSTGAPTAPLNVGATDNRSLSLHVTYYFIKQRDFNWYVNANLNHNTTEYYNIGNVLEEFNKKGQASASLMRYYDNASTTGLYAVRSAGIDPSTGNEVFIKKDGTYTYEWKQENEVLCGDTNPDVTGAFQTSVVWKGFSFGASFTYKAGGMITLSTLLNKVENISSEQLKYNQDKRALYSRWKKPGDQTKFKRIDDTNPTNMSSRFLAKENTLQCTSINFGYRATATKWLQAIGASSVNFTAYMNDIFRLSSIKEERGTDYPFERSVSFSMSINF